MTTPILTEDEKRQILKDVKPFCHAVNSKAVIDLILNLTLFFAGFAGMIYGLFHSYWITFLLLPLTGVLLTRIFTIQHDCGHGSFFTSRRANNILGIILGIITLTPYYYWRKCHKVHHAFSGNLDKRGCGDVMTLTVDEYQKRDFWGKLQYRAFRHPIFILVLAPILLFGFKHRLPVDDPYPTKKSWTNIMFTNVGVISIIAGLWIAFGAKAFFLVYVPVVWVASAFGLGLFFVQHQYEDTYWHHNEEWSYFDAGYYGSSYFEFPKPINWLINEINLHHIHHLNGHIPAYRLRECLNAIPAMQKVEKRRFKDMMKCFSLSLWDEKERKMIGFKQLKAA